MGRTVDELLDGMSGVEWQRWIEFNAIEPFTEDRADLRAAMLCSTVAQVHGVKTRPSDFMPTFGPPPEREQMTDEEIEHQAVKITAMFGGTVRK